MTIRLRNRITLGFFLVSFITFVLESIFTVYALFTSKLSFPEVYLKSDSDIFLFAFNPYIVLASVALIMLYVCVTSHVLFRSFSKTQATDMVFFLLFLAACVFDSARLFVPLLNISGIFTKLEIKIGNATLLARLLAPLGLFGASTLSEDDMRQKTERNCLIIILAAWFFSEFIPLNNAVILPNFSISYGYQKTIRILTFIISFLSIGTMFLNNYKNDYKQIRTLGFALICVGYTALFDGYSIFHFSIGAAAITAGTIMYLSELHKHYMWLD